MQPSLNDYNTLLPFLMLTAWATVLLFVDLFIPKSRKGITAFLAALGLVIALIFTVLQIGQHNRGFNGMAVLDGFSTFINITLLIGGLFGVALAHGYIRRMGIERGEYYTLLLFSLTGMMLMAQASDLIILFLALELLSIPLYVLAAISRKPDSEEAGVKYFLLGAFATGFVVYGTALVFGATGYTSFSGIFASASGGTSNLLLTIGAALLLIGFGFKVAAVPFHMWTPDVYQGAPSAVTAFMSAGAKIAGFAALFRVFATAIPSVAVDLSGVFWAMSALTMILGNLVAISQSNIKRMLAYSSIAQAGYILMAFVPYGNKDVLPVSIAAGLFYLLAYAITNFGAWAVVISVERAEGKGLDFADYSGLARKYPLHAASMAVFMISLIGFPPTLGMVGKFYLFRAAIAGGYTGLAVIGVLTSLVSAYYYLRVVVNMYMRDGEAVAVRDPWLSLTALVTALATVGLSIVPQWMFLLASTAVLQAVSR